MRVTRPCLVAIAAALLAPSAGAAQEYCWTCQYEVGCVLTNSVLRGYSYCESQYYPVEGCWLYPPECYPWVGPPTGFIDDGVEGRLTLRKSSILSYYGSSCVPVEAPQGEGGVPTWYAVQPPSN
jgi:hypothetical protein